MCLETYHVLPDDQIPNVDREVDDMRPLELCHSKLNLDMCRLLRMQPKPDE